MSATIEFRDSVDHSVIEKGSEGTLIEEAFDDFVQGIGKCVGKRARETRPVTDEIIRQYTKLQTPKTKVKFGDSEVVIFDKNEEVGSLERKDLSGNDPSVLPRPILKIKSQPDCDRNEDLSTQEIILEIFRRCYSLCNIPVSLLDENHPCEALEILCEGIQKALKAKDFCYKHVKDEENRRHSEELKVRKYRPQLAKRIVKFQEQIQEYETKIRDLTNQVTTTSNKNSNLLAENLRLQASNGRLDNELQSKSGTLEQLKFQNVELGEQNTKLKNQCDDLTRRWELLEVQHADITQLNRALSADVQKWTSHNTKLKVSNDNLEVTNKNLETKVFELESENSGLRNDLQDLKGAFKKNLGNLVDENILLRGQLNTCQTNFNQLKTDYDVINLKQKEIIEEKEKYLHDSRRYFDKTLKLQFQLDEHKHFREQATNSNKEKHEYQRQLKKLEYDYYTLQKSSHQLFLQNRDLTDYRKAAERILEDMGSKIANLEDDRETDALKIDSLTRQILRQTQEPGQPRETNSGGNDKHNLLRSLANTRGLIQDPMTLNRNIC